MFCGKCGNQLQNGDLFCGKCGAKVIYETPPIVQPESPLQPVPQIPPEPPIQTPAQVQPSLQAQPEPEIPAAEPATAGTAVSCTEQSTTDPDRRKNLYIALGIILLIVGIIIYFLNYEPQKTGTLTLPYGVYNGQIMNNQPNGKGVMTFKDNSKLEGTFKNGLVEGTARVTLPDGTYSEGPYVNGKRDGNWVTIKNNSYYLYYQLYFNDKPFGSERKEVPIQMVKYEVYNFGESNNSPMKTITNASIRTADTKFIGSTVTFTNSFPKPWRGEIFVKYIGPNGYIKRNPEKSPDGYSFSQLVILKSGESIEDFSGWGNEDGYAYSPGTYTIEYYWDNNLLGKTTFTVTD